MRLPDQPARAELSRSASGRTFHCEHRADGSSAIFCDDDRLTPAGVVITGWSPTPDGRRVVFATSPDGDREHRFAVADMDGRVDPVPDVPTHRPVPLPIPHGSGFWIVAADSTRPVLVPLPGRPGVHPWEDRPRPLADERVHGARVLALSPDGERLAVLARTASEERVWLASARPDDERDDDRAGGRDARLVARAEAGAISWIGFDPDGRLSLVSSVDSDGGEVLVAADDEASRWHRLPRADRNGPLPPTDRIVGVCWSRDGDGSPIALVHLQRDAASLLVGQAADGRALSAAFAPGPSPGTALQLAPGPAPGRFAAVWSAPLHPPRTVEFGAAGPIDGAAQSRPDRTGPAGRVDRTIATTFTASDGIEVPVVISEASTGPGPTVLTCYGGFGLSLPPAYSAAVAAWVAAGGRWIAVGVRGGSERGPAWHRAGRGRRKPRTVADLADAAGWALSTGRAIPGRLGLYGSSHGGLIAASAAARDPARYAALAVSAPLVDVWGFHRHGPGRTWVSELGDPDDPADAHALTRIDPLRIADAASGPAVLVIVGRRDRRVPPAHGRALATAWREWGSGPDGRRRAPLPELREYADLGHVSRDSRESSERAEHELEFLFTALTDQHQTSRTDAGSFLPTRADPIPCTSEVK